MRKIENQSIRKVQKSHGVYYVSIPIAIAREMKIKERQKLVVDYDKRGKRIIIRDWKE